MVLLAGAFVGLSHSLLGVINNINYISFQTVQVCTMSFIIYLFEYKCSDSVGINLNKIKNSPSNDLTN